MEYLVSVFASAGIFLLLGFSTYIIAMTGQLSFGQHGLFAFGAYLAAMCTTLWGMGLAPALIVGALGSGVLAFAVSFPILRVRGLYFSVATLAFGEMVRLFFLNLNYQTEVAGQLKGPVGTIGFRLITYNQDHAITAEKYLGIVYLIVALVVVFFVLLERSRLGSVLRITEEDETAAEALGVNVSAARVLAFTIGGVLAGLGGGLYAHHLTFLKHNIFTIQMAVLAVAYSLIGGLGSLVGPIFGVALFTFLTEALRAVGPYRLIAFGAVIIGVLIFRPRGIIDEELIRKVKSLGRRETVQPSLVED